MGSTLGCSWSSGRSGRAASCLLFSMFSLWSPCYGDLEGKSRSVRHFYAGTLSTKVSAYADDITVFGHNGYEEGGCEVWADSFPRLKSDPKVERRHQPKGETPFAPKCCKALRNLPRSSAHSRSRKELYRQLVVDSVADPLVMVDGGGSLALELGAWFGLLEQFRILAHLAPRTERAAPFQPELQSVPGRYARLSSLRQWLRRNSWTRLLLLRVSSSVLGSYRRGGGLNRTQAARAARRWLRRGQCFPSASKWEYPVVFGDPSCRSDRMVIWTTRKKGLYDGANLSHRDLILFFRDQFRVKIRCDRKRLGCRTASLVVQTLKSSSPLFLRMATTDRVLQDSTRVCILFVPFFPSY